ncbi:MAG: hypothetical protein HQL69_18920 [Magnetococcales bacterium]|nr:hypothetical protein [Magnetococcales bacterium]
MVQFRRNFDLDPVDALNDVNHTIKAIAGLIDGCNGDLHHMNEDSLAGLTVIFSAVTDTIQDCVQEISETTVEPIKSYEDGYDKGYLDGFKDGVKDSAKELAALKQDVGTIQEVKKGDNEVLKAKEPCPIKDSDTPLIVKCEDSELNTPDPLEDSDTPLVVNG